MTSAPKKMILFSVVFFAAYTQYKAEQTVKQVRASEQADKEISIREQFMTRALELSQVKTSEEGTGGGSVIVKEGRVIGEGWNNNKLLNDPTAHAEILSIINACRNLNSNDLIGTEIYTAVQPCPRCISLIRTIGIENVYYSVPRWKIKQSNFGLSQEYLNELMTRSRINRKVREIQVTTKDGDKYVGLL